MARSSWLDDDTNEIKIDEYSQKLESFVAAMEDGVIDSTELEDQEKRVAELMKEIEPGLDDETHAKITRLLAEMTAYNTMQLLHEIGKLRPQTKFVG